MIGSKEYGLVFGSWTHGRIIYVIRIDAWVRKLVRTWYMHINISINYVL